jgi:glutaredoxin
VKEFLSREGHEFVARNVEEDHGAYTELLQLGFRAVPVTLVDGQAITGFDEPALRRALHAAGR